MTSVENEQVLDQHVVGNTQEEADLKKKQIEDDAKMWNIAAKLVAVVCLIIILIIVLIYSRAIQLIRGSYLDEAGHSWLVDLDGVRVVARSPRTNVDVCIADGGWLGVTHLGGLEFDAVPDGLAFSNGTFWRRIG